MSHEMKCLSFKSIFPKSIIALGKILIENTFYQQSRQSTINSTTILYFVKSPKPGEMRVVIDLRAVLRLISFYE